jgi:hypothetical protein
MCNVYPFVANNSAREDSYFVIREPPSSINIYNRLPREELERLAELLTRERSLYRRDFFDDGEVFSRELDEYEDLTAREDELDELVVREEPASEPPAKSSKGPRRVVRRAPQNVVLALRFADDLISSPDIVARSLEVREPKGDKGDGEGGGKDKGPPTGVGRKAAEMAASMIGQNAKGSGLEERDYLAAELD